MISEEPVDALSKTLQFLERLEAAKIWHRLEHVRDSLMVILAVPGERWEVEFFEDGHIEFERFASTGVKRDEDLLNQMLEEQEGADKATGVD